MKYLANYGTGSSVLDITSLCYGVMEGFYVGQIDIFCGTTFLSSTIFLIWASVTFDQDNDQEVYP